MSDLRDPRLGVVDEAGEQMPLVSVSGAPYAGRGGGVHGIGDGLFVVLDTFPPADFDLAAAVAELQPDVLPAPVKKARATNGE